jgi:NAD(P)-dependent dehydrogenase (short-subunit alcohol dehydrogenase family)
VTNTDRGFLDFAGRSVVVTGASSGLGVAFAQAFAEAGADVVLGARRVEKLERVADSVRSTGRRVHTVATDVADPDQCQRLVDEAMAKFGRVDVLVNNAGVALTAPAESVTEEEWDTALDVNARGAFFLAQALGRGMLARGCGRIVNVTSQAALGGLADHAAYCASKAALTLVTRVLAVEWGPRGVTCNAVAPTVILTPMGERVWGDPARAAPMLARIPVGRFGVPAEVASVVAFLASDLAAMINGETISVDGGYSAQ